MTRFVWTRTVLLMSMPLLAATGCAGSRATPNELQTYTWHGTYQWQGLSTLHDYLVSFARDPSGRWLAFSVRASDRSGNDQFATTYTGREDGSTVRFTPQSDRIWLFSFSTLSPIGQSTLKVTYAERSTGEPTTKDLRRLSSAPDPNTWVSYYELSGPPLLGTRPVKIGLKANGTTQLATNSMPLVIVSESTGDRVRVDIKGEGPLSVRLHLRGHVHDRELRGTWSDVTPTGDISRGTVVLKRQ